MPSSVNADPIAEFVVFAVLVCWFLFALAFIVRKPPPKATVMKRSSHAMIGIALQVVAYFLVWFRPLQRRLYSPLLPMPRWVEVAIGVVTLVVAVGSIWLARSAVRRLGKQWAVAAQLVEGHNLITDGPYRIVRNPIYSGMFGMLIATGLAASRWNILLVAILIFLIGAYIRIQSEERLLREAFGSEYEEYAQRVPALIPGIY